LACDQTRILPIFQAIWRKRSTSAHASDCTRAALMADDHERIGYRNPPKRTQFKPGTSGNPAGRPPGLNSFDADLRAALSEETLVRANGAERNISKQRAMIDALVAAALSGEMRAVLAVLSYCARVSSSQASHHPAPTSDSDDLELVVDMERRQRRGSAQSKIKPASSDKL
jgi:hypothetical protein